MTNNTEYEEMLIAGRIRAKEYYDKNKERLRKKARDRYNRIKNGEPPSGKKGGRPKNNIDPICECLSCGEKFKVRLSEYKRGGGKYCSTDCFKESQRSKINSDFFANPTPEMAYALGVFMSDGYLTKKTSAGKDEQIEIKDFMRNGKLVKGFKKDRIFQDGIHSSQNRKKKEKEGSE